MKKVLLFAFILIGSIQFVSAQTASIDAAQMEEAKKVADQNEDIQVWECKKSGSVTFVKTVKDNQGNDNFVPVTFDDKSKTFVESNQKPSCSVGEKASCASKDAKAASCCASKGEAKATADTKTTEASCASQADAKKGACCASKKTDSTKS